jgi:hypothetical protein
MYAVAPACPYLLIFGLSLWSAVLIGTMRLRVVERVKEPPTLATSFAAGGIRTPQPGDPWDHFSRSVRGAPRRATALLPIDANDIRHTGAWAWGLLRAVRCVADDRGAGATPDI